MGIVEDRRPNSHFWYSRQSVIMFLAFLLLLVQAMSYLIPPFQSPDEFNHLKRAYLLSKGDIFLKSKDNLTGGNIDSGLLDYMGYFKTLPFDYNKKITSRNNSSSKNVVWSGERQFSDLPNTAEYFPLSYMPQALSFVIGEQAGLSVSSTYYLARFFSLMATLGLLWAAFTLFPVPPIVLALFATPMTLFQLGSASLDSVSFAMTVLAASLFMRGSDRNYTFSSGMLIALSVCLFALATTRINLIVLTLLPVILYSIRGNKSYLIASIALIFFSLAWIGFVLNTVQGMPTRELTTIGIIKYYLSDPASFFHVLFVTLTSADVWESYWKSYIGILGWQDAPLRHGVYVMFGILLFILALISLQRDKARLLDWGSLSLTCGALASIFLLYVIFLTTWMPHPAKVILGIQGRYFTPPLILLAFSIFNKTLSGVERKIGLFIIFVMIACSIASMAPELLDRYYMN